jgi:fibronectin-binding autotransporter adhesin
MVSIGSLTKQGSKPLILGGNNSFSKLTVSGPGVVVITNSTVLSGKAKVSADVNSNNRATLVVTNGAYFASTSGSIGSSDNTAWSIQYHRGLVGGGSSANKAVWNLSGGGLVIGGGGNNNAYNSLKIDQGGMVTNAGAITLGLSYGCYDNYMIITNGGYLASTGTAIIGNQNVASRNYVYIGGASGSTHSIWNLGGATLIIGNNSGSANDWMTVGVGGTLTNVSTLTLGPGGSPIFNLSGGDAYVSKINLSVASAALKFTNGGVLHASTSGNLLSGSGTNYFLAGGGTIDTAGFTVTNSVVNAGTGGMTKTGSGKLVLTSTNTSVGAIIINGGTLALQATNSLSTGTDLYIVTGATNLLNYTGEQYIHAVYINGKLQKHSPITTLNSAPYFVGEGKLIPAVVGPPEGIVFSLR